MRIKFKIFCYINCFHNVWVQSIWSLWQLDGYELVMIYEHPCIKHFIYMYCISLLISLYYLSYLPLSSIYLHQCYLDVTLGPMKNIFHFFSDYSIVKNNLHGKHWLIFIEYHVLFSFLIYKSIDYWLFNRRV